MVGHHARDADALSELIKSIRETTGDELGWFFREWVFMAGRPDYRVAASYDATKKTEKVTVTQTQRTDAETPIFDMPIELAFYGANGERKKIQVRDNLQQQEFEIPLDFEPRWVDFDPDSFIDKTVQFDKPVDAPDCGSGEGSVDDEPACGRPATELTTLANPDERVEALAQVMSNDGFYGVRAALRPASAKSEPIKPKMPCSPQRNNRTAGCGRRCSLLWGIYRQM